MAELSAKVSSAPSFEEITGVTSQEMMEHSATAIQLMMERGQGMEPEMVMLMRIYTLGFTVGIHYEREQLQ